LKGGEYPLSFLPSLQGEGQGWGLYCYYSCLLSFYDIFAAEIAMYYEITKSSCKFI
jgi:hypothetical protein